MSNNKTIIINILVISLWLLNPWLGLLTLIGILVFFSPESHFRQWMFVILIALTMMLYELSLPAPHDLLTTIKHYLKMSTNREVAWAWITKDVLSYTVFNILNGLFPKWPITFYFLNFSMVIASVWIIFKKEADSFKDDYLKIALLFGLFIAGVDYLELHHYLRQTTALFLFFVSFYFLGIKRWALVLISVLWHGSIILLIPLFLIMFFIKDRNRSIFLYATLFLIAYGISQVNIYEFFQGTSHSNDIFKFNFADRYFTYFTEPRHVAYFKLQQEMGNPLIGIYLISSIFTIGFALFTGETKKYYLSAIVVVTIWLIVFQYHALVFNRLAYVLEILLVMFWLMQIKHITKMDHRLIAICTVCVCVMKIHFFAWPIITKLDGHYLFLSSPVSLIKNFSRWDINREYHQLRKQ